ncbi:5'-3' exoribonuclease [Firmicutes bacterium ASF500]|nr:5'-3' exoribonuclease [Firmicutes bacterium ASF500]
MTKKADLHTHSTASDGQYTPTELVSLAKDSGLEVLALTDHDTMDGLEEAIRAGGRLGLRVIPGVELSAREYPTFHILGYGFRLEAPPLAELCRRMKARRDERVEQLLAFLQEKGVELSAAEVEELAGGSIIGRPHFAQAMVRRGYVSTNREAFDRYLDTEEYHERVERGKPSAQECIEAIKSSGGKVSLAHPYQIGVDNAALEAIVRKLTEYGLDAIECCYPKHSPAQQRFYLELSERYCLHVTGGSDFHGERVKPDIRLTTLELDVEWIKTG